MMRMRENAESVAFYSGEKQEGGVFKKRFKLLLDNFWKIVEKQKQLVWLNSGYSQIAIIFPFVVAMPRYLSKEINNIRRPDPDCQCLWQGAGIIIIFCRYVCFFG